MRVPKPHQHRDGDPGELRFYEHVRAETPALAAAQRATGATFWPRLAGGCHTSRDTAAAITAAGFTIDTVRGLRFPPALLASPHLIGTAHRPLIPHGAVPLVARNPGLLPSRQLRSDHFRNGG